MRSVALSIAAAAIKAARANHYLVTLVLPPDFDCTYEDASDAASVIADEENAGRLSHKCADRAFMLLSQATGYSLSDLGA